MHNQRFYSFKGMAESYEIRAQTASPISSSRLLQQRKIVPLIFFHFAQREIFSKQQNVPIAAKNNKERLTQSKKQEKIKKKV